MNVFDPDNNITIIFLTGLKTLDPHNEIWTGGDHGSTQRLNPDEYTN